MKIIHCADIHLGSPLTAHYDEKTASRRSAELFRTFAQMFAYAEENEVAAILIAGDLFDRDKGIRKLKENVMRLVEGHPGIKVYYLRGNHDLDLSEEKYPTNLYQFGNTWTTYEPAPGILITGAECSDVNKPMLYETLHLPEETFNIVTLHGTISTAKEGLVLSLRSLHHRHIDYLALGHLHSFSEGQIDYRGQYVYPGCLEGRGFDETGEHGFVLLDVDPKTHRYKYEFIPFAARKIISEEIAVGGVETDLDIVAILKEKIARIEHHDDDLAEFILTGDVPETLRPDLTFITEQIRDDFFYVRIIDRLTYREDPEQYRSDLSLKGSFVRLVCDRNDLSKETKNEILRTGLDLLGGKEIS